MSLNFCGGAQIVTLAMIDALKARGHEVTLITADKVDWEKVKRYLDVGRLADHEESVIPYDMVRRLARSPIQGSLLITSFVGKLLSSMNKYDVVIDAYGDLDIAMTVANICFFNSFPFSLSHLFPRTAPSLMRKWYSRGLYRVLKKLSPKRKGCLPLTNSHYMKGILKRYLKLSPLVVHPPVNRDLCSGFDKEDVVITISRYVPGKELHKLLLIAKLVDDVRFLVVGRAYDRAYISLMLRLKDSLDLDNVEILANLPRKQLISLICRAKLYLHTNAKEPFGISILEAMASGCVPIVPRDGGPWTDILAQTDGVYGYSYSNSAEAAFYIRKLIEDNCLWNEMSLRCVERSKSFDRRVFNYKISKIVEEYANRLRGEV